MIYKIVAPDSPINTRINLPASKSISNRALILNKLSNSPYLIENLSNSDDTRVMEQAFKNEENKEKIIDVGAAGTSMRFLSSYFSRVPGEWIITGTKRMKNRPIQILVNALTALGARIEYVENSGYPPLKIKGSALEGGEIYLSGAISSQFISSLLMIAPVMEKGLTIHLEGDIISLPYIKLTLKMMSDYGVKTEWVDNTITIYSQIYKPIHYTVESDWSAASYWYEIAALSDQAEITLEGLTKNSPQGDSRVADLFIDLGIETAYKNDSVVLTKTNRFTKKYFHDFVNEPDLAQTLAVTCCMLNIPFFFSGLQSLKIKETDRIEALKNELKKFGYVLKDRDNSILEWDGEKCEMNKEPIIETYEDHRMAMAFAPVALKKKNIKIKEPMVITKSYRHFWKDLEKAGFQITNNGTI